MNKEEFAEKEHFSAEDLAELIALLRAPDGCPWDRAQTHASVRRGIIEEAYEVAEAIDRDDPDMLTEELGDLLMQVYFHAQIGAEERHFTLQDIHDRICKKLIFRHPHIFSDSKIDTSTEEGWAAIKRLEKGQKTPLQEMEGIAQTLPALTRAEKLAGKAYSAEDTALLYELLSRQAAELAHADNTAAALGSLLFTAARLAKALKIDPEEALTRENQRQIALFKEKFE